MTPSNLKCEYLVDPLGIDILAPRLSWNLDSFSRNESQTAYQILVAQSFSELEENTGSLWDSGKVETSNTLHIPYSGSELSSTRRCYWKVRVWNQDGLETPYSQPAVWEMGLLTPEDWHGGWLGATTETEPQPAPLFRRAFTIEKTIREARAYVSGLGYGELHVNGKRVSDSVLDPGLTRYDKRVLYVAYDVTENLKHGPNALGIILGNGFYNIHQSNPWNHDEAPWRAAPKFILELRIEFTDGTFETVTSDDQWKTAHSPILWNSFHGGETYDARLEKADWSAIDYDDSGWSPALSVDAPAGKLSAQLIPPIKVNQSLRPASLKQPKPGVHVYDFGQNFSGFIELALNAPDGTEITIKYGERLAEDGTLDQSHIAHLIKEKDASQRFQTDVYITKGGEDLEVWSPRFTYHGFQYAELTFRALGEGAETQAAPEASAAAPDADASAIETMESEGGESVELEGGVTSIPELTLDLDTISGQFIHSSVTPVGVFSSSSELLNKIWQATRWSYLSNLQSIPTDCPQREKNGWMGDAHLAADAGIYNFDTGAFYTKYLNDIQDEQRETGDLPGIVPTSGWGYTWGNGPAWDSAYTLLAWDLYNYYGDTRIAEVHFENLKRYVDYLTSRAEDGIVSIGLGDWAKYDTETSVALTDTGYYFVNAILLAEAAERLGKTGEAGLYAELAASIKTAFNTKFYNPETAEYDNGSQTALSAALYQGLADEENIPRIVANLVKSIEEHDVHLDTGILGAKYVMNALSDHGHADLAYKLATQTTLPSWGYWIETLGATTLYESWKDVDSRNHIMFGDIGAWVFRILCGISPAAPGFKEILIKPHIVGDLVHASGIYDSISGRIVSDWRLADGNLVLFLQIPTNTSAEVYVPTTDASAITEGGRPLAEVPGVELLRKVDGYAVLKVPAGRYMFGGPYAK